MQETVTSRNCRHRKIITRLCRRIFKSNRAVLNVAPTSAAAVLLPDGRTVHSVTPPPMKKKKNCTMSPVDYPLNAHAMNRMKTLALGADNKFALMCINADERGMMGKALTACFSHRFNELGTSLFPNADNSIFGCVPCFNFFGDIFQLGAICAVDLQKVPLSSSTPCNIAGHAVYKAFTDVIILDEVVRQKPSQIKLLNRLNHIRIGKVDQKDWNEINDRAFNNLHDNEKKKFNKENPNLILLTETWDEANKYNYDILASHH